MVELSYDKIIWLTLWVTFGIAMLVAFFCWALVQYYQTRSRQQHDLLNAINEAQEKERLHIAREMHDNFGNIFATILLEISTLDAIEDEAGRNASIAYLKNNIALAKDELRQNVRSLAPGNLKNLKWISELNYLKNFLEKHGKQLHLTITGPEVDYADNSQTNLYRICQELVNNALKHSGSTDMWLEVVFAEKDLNLSFSDEGKGFDMQEKKNNESYGFRSLFARTKAMYGHCSYEASPDKGVSWRFEFKHKHLI